MSISQRPDIAACRVTGSSGAIVGGFGIASVTRNGNGDYTLVTNQAFDSASVIRMNVLGGASKAVIQDTPDANGTTHAIKTYVDGTATDENFSFEIERVIT